MSEEPVGCARPTGSVVGDEPEASPQPEPERKEKPMSTARVGGKAPDFQAPAYHEGKFIQIKLSERIGKWILLCFYPGDFTFV